MASIIERNGRYFVRVRRHGFPTVSKTFTRRSDAATWARAVEADMEAGRWRIHGARVPTFREVVQEYRRVVASKMKGAESYRYYFDQFEALPFATSLVTQVKASDLARWRDGQLERVSPGTVVRRLAMISSILTWAMKERGWIAQNPAFLVTKPKSSDSRTRTLSEEEVHWLMKAASTSKARWLPAALTVLMSSAMRRGELCRLRRQNVDFDLATAHLTETKSGHSRDVPLCPRALAALRELDAAAKARRDDLLVPIGPEGSFSTRFIVTVRRAREMYQRACADAGVDARPGFLDDLRLHDLRHHAVTGWASTGALSTVELMAISGHRTTRMLVRYTHLQANALATKLAQLSGAAACEGGTIGTKISRG